MVQGVSREIDGICIIHHWFQFTWSKSHFREAWKPGGPWTIGYLSSLSYIFCAQGWCKGASFHPWMSLINSPSPAPRLLLSTPLSNWLSPWLTESLEIKPPEPQACLSLRHWGFGSPRCLHRRTSRVVHRGTPESWRTITGVLQRGGPWPDELKWMPCSFFSHWRARHMIVSVFTDVQLCWAHLQFAHQNAMCGEL